MKFGYVQFYTIDISDNSETCAVVRTASNTSKNTNKNPYKTINTCSTELKKLGKNLIKNVQEETYIEKIDLLDISTPKIGSSVIWEIKYLIYSHYESILTVTMDFDKDPLSSYWFLKDFCMMDSEHLVENKFYTEHGTFVIDNSHAKTDENLMSCTKILHEHFKEKPS